jgi:deazaflavin-dependent oxidoreductase (nitroreductase family)
MNLRDTVTDFGGKLLNLNHRLLRALSGGRLGDRAFGMPVVELHTTGRKSGLRRSNLLTAPLMSDDRVVLVASKGGDDRHPDWYRNLTDSPDIELTIGGQTRPMRARTASAEEKSELWPQVVAAYKGYAAYQRRTGRDIPLVICEPPAG